MCKSENAKKQNRNWSRKLSAIVLVLVMLVSTVSSVPTAYATETITFNTSNIAEENIQIDFQGSNIIFKDFPDSSDFNYVMLSLYGEDGNTYLKNAYSTASDITMSVLGVADGTYYIQIYKAPEQYTTYWSYMYGKKGIKISIQDGLVSYTESPVYEHNKALFESNLTSEEALEYYLEPSYGVESDNKTIIKKANSIVSKSDSDYEKVKKVHDWVANNVWYDWDGLLGGIYGDNSSTGVLESKRAVCQGYANLSAALLRALGIPTKVISGYALGATGGSQWTESLITGDTTNHAWNEAYVDGRWIIFDATWDSSNKYENSSFSTGTGLDGYKYFDPAIENFSYDHKIVENEPYGEKFDKMAIDSIEVRTWSITLYKGSKTEKSKKIAPKVGKYNGESLKNRIKFVYTSGNPSIAKVNKKGKVTGKKVGTTVINVQATAGIYTMKWSVNVTVK